MDLPILSSPLDRVNYIIQSFFDSNAKEFAKKCDIENAHLSRIRNRKASLTMNILHKIADAMPEIPYEWLKNGVKIDSNNKVVQEDADELFSEYNKLLLENKRLKKVIAILLDV